MDSERIVDKTISTENKGPESKTKFIIIGACAVVLAIIVGVIVYLNSPAQRVGKQMDLGNKYLQELDYEQAVAAFKLALDIDPTNEDAKQGLSSAYIGWSKALAESGDIDSALAKLDEARTVIGDQENIISLETDLLNEQAEPLIADGNFDKVEPIQTKLDEIDKQAGDELRKKVVEKKEQIRKEEEEAKRKAEAEALGLPNIYDYIDGDVIDIKQYLIDCGLEYVSVTELTDRSTWDGWNLDSFDNIKYLGVTVTHGGWGFIIRTAGWTTIWTENDNEIAFDIWFSLITDHSILIEEYTNVQADYGTEILHVKNGMDEYYDKDFITKELPPVIRFMLDHYNTYDEAFLVDPFKDNPNIRVSYSTVTDTTLP